VCLGQPEDAEDPVTDKGADHAVAFLDLGLDGVME
jgi:hypothetical protein